MAPSSRRTQQLRLQSRQMTDKDAVRQYPFVHGLTLQELTSAFDSATSRGTAPKKPFFTLPPCETLRQVFSQVMDSLLDMMKTMTHRDYRLIFQTVEYMLRMETELPNRQTKTCGFAFEFEATHGKKDQILLFVPMIRKDAESFITVISVDFLFRKLYFNRTHPPEKVAAWAACKTFDWNAPLPAKDEQPQLKRQKIESIN